MSMWLRVCAEGTINFPSHFSKEAVSIIKKLLQHKPTKRLGVVNGGAAEIKKVRHDSVTHRDRLAVTVFAC